MSGQIVVPSMGESVSEAIIARWFKKAGDAVKADEAVCELETDKVTLEVYASTGGVIKEILAPEGATVAVGAVLCKIDESAKGASAPAQAVPTPAKAPVAQAAPVAAEAFPAAKKIATENQVPLSDVSGSGKDGRVTKGDVIDYMERKPAGPAVVASAGPREERVRMSALRKKIAERLKASQNTAAILTTFNEIDMTNVMQLRSEYKDSFEKKHGIRLGFMSFFIKAACTALKEVPSVNAQIDGDSLVYKNYCDIGVAVGTEQGLVVPVIRDADQLSIAEIEKQIVHYAKKARDGKITMDDMTGGTFTITNGGVYGSLMATPIINPPQSGILGMHKVQERPVAINGQVVIRPMMYVALSYDHRIIDGKESVTFLVKVKEYVEDPRRLLLS